MDDRQNDGQSGLKFFSSRRELLTRTGLLVGGFALLGMPKLRPLFAAPADSRIHSSGSSALDLDGQFMGFLKSAEGGFPKADVMYEPAGPAIKKRLGQVTYQDIAIQCEPLMAKPLFDWIAGMMTMAFIRKNGAVITTDFNGAEQSRLQFTNAIITEFGIPACDASSKESSFLNIKFSPEVTAFQGGKGSVLPAIGAKSKVWLSSNFRLTIPGLDCSKILKIHPLTVKYPLGQSAIGQKLDVQREPGKLDFPNLVISIPESSAGTFYAWFQDMVVRGNTGENKERPGTLELLDSSLKGTLLTVNFHHLGIFGFTPEQAETHAGSIRRIKVEMYCEQMTLAPVKV